MNKFLFFLLSFLLLLLHITVLSTTEFIDWPELLLYPWLVKNDFVPYVDLYIPYPALPIDFLKTIYDIAGYTPQILRYFHLLLMTVTDVALLLILGKMTKSHLIAILSFFIYILWQPGLEGNGVWFDTLTLLPLLVGFYSLLIFIRSSKWSYAFSSGILLGIAVFTKQTTLTVILGLVLYILYMNLLDRKNDKINYKILIVIFIIILAPVLQLTFFLYKGILKEHFFWSYLFPYNLKTNSLYIIPPNWWGDLPIIMLILITTILFFYTLFLSKRKNELVLVFCFFLSLLLLMFPRWNLTHFQSGLIFLVLLLSLTFQHLIKYNFRIFLFSIFLIFVLSIKYQISYLKKSYGKQPRFFNTNTQKLLHAIKEIKKQDDYYLFGNTEYLYVYLFEVPKIKPYVQMFPWNTDISGIENEQIQELQNRKIKYIFYQPYHPNNVYYNGRKPEQMFSYIKGNYRPFVELPNNVEVLIKLED